jgi:GT2 family glycosyltransferase
VSPTASVAVVIPSWNSAQLLPACLDSLQGQLPGLELFVVDNGSTDGSLDYLRRRAVPHLPLPHNVGFAAAINLGVRRTRAAAVLVLNADAVLEPGCLATLQAALVDEPGLAGVQPRILQLGGELGPIDSAPVYSAGMALTRDGRAFERGAGEGQRPELLRRGEIFGVCGAACMLRREAFLGLGGYDESYFAFYEDVDLNVRARIAGWRFAYVPEAVAWHVGNASWSTGFRRPNAENAGSLLRAARQRRFVATLRGKTAALAWLPRLLRERRRLRREGDPELSRRWLGA